MGCTASSSPVSDSVHCVQSMYFSGLSFTSLADMARNYGPNPSNPNVARQKEHQEQAFAYLSQALNIDEGEEDVMRKTAAIALYEKGVEHLELGIRLHLPVNNADASLVRAHKLREKMRRNLETTRERLNYLSTNLHLNKLSMEAGQASSSILRKTSVRTPLSSIPSRTTPIISDKRTKIAYGNSKPNGVSSSGGSAASGRLPRNNRAAELRLKTVTGVSGGVSSRRPSSRSADSRGEGKDVRESLKSKCSGIKGVDPKLVEMILTEVVPKNSTGTRFADVLGQEKAKAALHEMVVLPSLRPELFTGLRTPAKGLLMFGPPGNGKTLMARALATEANCNLVNISSSSLTSKWVGEGEKLVRALFSVARALQPAIIFIDEIDALLSERRSGEHEALRRMKTEFLLQFEGMVTGSEERVVVVAATNRPQELDDAALRRLTKRVYVEMPDSKTRAAILTSLLARNGSSLPPREIDKIVAKTQGYTCSDVTNLAKDAAMAPIREISTVELATIRPEDMRKLTYKDFEKSCERVRPSLSSECLGAYTKWNQAFGDIS